MRLRLAPRLRFALFWPVLATVAVTVPVIWLAGTGPLASALILASAIALLLLGPVSWWLDRRLFRPLEEIIDGADRLAAGELASRVEVPEARELATLAQGLNHLAAEVEEQLRLLGDERDHLREILASMSEGVLVTDGDGRVRLSNAAFRRILGLEGDLAGRSVAEVSGQPALAERIAAALAEKTLTSGELELEGKPRRHLSLLAAPLRRGHGVVVVVRDMTDELRLAEIRRDLVANVSHELKTPLTAIRGYAETLEQGAIDDPAVAPRFVRRIREQCERLEALLRDLLTLSRLEQLDHREEAESLDVGELARRAVEVLTPRARERRVELKLEAAVAPRVAGPGSEVENLLLNLIDNAVKYNRPGGEARVAVREQGGGVEIEVADTGIGIPEDALDRVFERFYRVDQGRSREQGGTGLGLAIVKHAAHLLGGRVEVESRLGKGSVFRVWLPAIAATHA